MRKIKGKKASLSSRDAAEEPETHIKSVDDLWYSYFPVSAKKQEIEKLNPTEMGFFIAQRSMDKVTGLNIASSPGEISGRSAFEMPIGKQGKMASKK